MPIEQNDIYAAYIDVRFRGDSAAALIPEIRRAIAAVNSNIPVRSISTLSEHIDSSLHDEALAVHVSALLGGLALLLAGLGLFGVMAFTVARRTGEIGIRMALGAERNLVLTMIVRESVFIVLIGVVVGLPLALAGSHALKSSLFGVTPSDPVTFSVAALIVLLTGLLAGSLPAQRAAKVDPMVALRYE
jgi:ABC-type antimicrobial peptide transport system permease subunit